MPVPATDPSEILFGAGSHPTHRSEHARLVTFGDTDMPRGIIALAYPDATPVLSTTYVSIATLVVPVVVNRLYRLVFQFRAWNNTSGAAGYLNIKTAETPAVVTGTTNLVIDALSWIPASAAFSSISWQQTFRAPTGTITIGLQARSPGGNIWLGSQFGNGGLWVEDIGPNRGLQ